MSTIFLGGTAGNDILTGGDGDDLIFGNGGKDIMSGGNGNDKLYSTNLERQGGDLQGDVMQGGAGADMMFGSDGNDRMDGNEGNDQLIGGAGHDWLMGGAGSNTIDGGIGFDTAVFAGVSADYTYGRDPATGLPVAVMNTAAGTSDALQNVERLQFADKAIAFDISGDAGQIYRLYQAVFNRQPDQAGMGFWLHVAEERGWSMRDIASGFFNSDEFRTMYASNSDADFLAKLYLNALHRPYDQAGLDSWLHAISLGVSREEILLGFAESSENQAQVIGSIQGGIQFTPFVA